MRFLVLCFLVLFAVSSAQDKLILSNTPPPLPKKQAFCAVQELYVIGLTTHDPAERHKAMLEWIDKAKAEEMEDFLTWLMAGALIILLLAMCFWWATLLLGK